MNILQREPVLLLDLLKAAVLAAVAFGLPLSDGQTTALLGVAGAVLALSGVARAAVTPVAKVEEIANDVGGNAIKLVGRLTGKGE